MEPLSTKELMELASCTPGPDVTNQFLLLESAEERIKLHKDILDGPVAVIVEECCDQMAFIATSLQRIEKHIERLVNKELKGTGQALMEIAGYIKAIAVNQIGEHNFALQLLQQQLLFGPPVPPVEPFAQAPETAPVGDSLIPEFVEATPEEFRPPPVEIIPPPAIVPSITLPPSFPPETSAAVGGQTFAAPVPTISLKEVPGGEILPDFINPEEAIA